MAIVERFKQESMYGFFCPPRREKVTVVERWPLAEFRLCWRKSRNMTIAKS